MAAKEITITLKEKEKNVSVGTFIKANTKLHCLLKEIEVSLAHNKGSGLEWVISELKIGSAVMTIRAESYTDLAYSPEDVIVATVRGIRELSSGATRPKLFSNAAMKYTKELANLLDNAVSTIMIDADSNNAIVSKAIIQNVDSVLSQSEEIGTIEGILKMISTAKKPCCSIYDTITGIAVNCELNNEFFEKAYNNFNKRVAISGLIAYTSDGYPIRVSRVSKITTFPEDKDLPTVDDLLAVKVDFSGGLSIQEFMEKSDGYEQ